MVRLWVRFCGEREAEVGDKCGAMLNWGINLHEGDGQRLAETNVRFVSNLT